MTHTGENNNIYLKLHTYIFINMCTGGSGLRTSRNIANEALQFKSKSMESVFQLMLF